MRTYAFTIANYNYIQKKVIHIIGEWVKSHRCLCCFPALLFVKKKKKEKIGKSHKIKVGKR